MCRVFPAGQCLYRERKKKLPCIRKRAFKEGLCLLYDRPKFFFFFYERHFQAPYLCVDVKRRPTEGFLGRRLRWQEEKEGAVGGKRRSSTAGLKTYVTVGSQQVYWERKLGHQQNTNVVTHKYSSNIQPLIFLFCPRYS